VLDLRANNRAQGQTPDLRLARLAERQHGIVTARQLRALGVSRRAREHRIEVGRLHPIHRGVYAVGHRNLPQDARFIAAVAAIGADAALSNAAAAALFELMRHRGDVDVTTARSVKPRPGIRLHVVRSLPPADVTRHRGIPVTTPLRTILDLAHTLDERRLARVAHEAEVQGLVTNAELRARLDGRSAPAKLRAIVAEGPVRTRSELEDVTYDLLRRTGFPRPEANTKLPGLPDWLEVDFHFPGTALVIEVDGGRFHNTRWRRRLDARKQAVLEAAGYRVLRLTWEQVAAAEAQTVERLRRALAM
jgi:predicted transcriptional regulator of viral defense system